MESNERVVVKFGDVPLADGEMVRKAAKMVFESKYREVALVVSAMGETTDQLVEAFFQSGGTSDEDYADFVSMGERTSARLFSASLRSLGASSILLEPGDLRWPILTDSDFREANVDLEKTKSLVESHVEPLISRTIPVLCRFLGVDSAGKLTTLGRGGSDTTALVLGNCLNADEVILVKDTNGILSADPRVVLEAKQFETISIEEMYSLAYCGAKIIEPEALRFKAMGQKPRVVSAVEGLRSKGTVITGDMSLNACKSERGKALERSAWSVIQTAKG